MKLKLIDKKELTESVKSFVFEAPEPLTWKPGQYLHYVLDHPNADDRKTERWFTISSAPYEQHPTITTRLTKENGSSFKKALDSLPIGGEIEGGSPEGDFVIEDPSQQYIFIAGGIGITPFHSMLKQMTHDNTPINVDLMYANRDDNSVFGDELHKIAKDNPNFRIHKFADPKKITPDDIKAIAGQLKDPQYYISGPWPMVDAYDKMLKEMGIDSSKIHNDDFPGYETI